MILVSSCPIHRIQALSREWRCSWSSVDRRCSNFLCVINKCIAYTKVQYVHTTIWKETSLDTRCAYLASILLGGNIKNIHFSPEMTYWITRCLANFKTVYDMKANLTKMYCWMSAMWTTVNKHNGFSPYHMLAIHTWGNSYNWHFITNKQWVADKSIWISCNAININATRK